MHVVGVRYGANSEQPICLSDIYIDAAYKAISSEIGRARTAICAIIEQHFGETIIEVEQQIEGAVLSEDEARRLGALEG